jgi:hypothetical protein
VLDEALVEGMRIGIDFATASCSSRRSALGQRHEGGMAILRPLLAETGAEPVGRS